MPEEKKGFFQRLKDGLFKTHEGLVSKIDQLMAGRKKIDEDLLAELEEILITSDIGVKTTQELLDNVTAKVRSKELEDAEKAEQELANKVDAEIAQILHQQERVDAEAEDLQRLQALAERYAERPEGVSDRVALALARAREKRTQGALQALERELTRMQEEEEMALLLLLNQDD